MKKITDIEIHKERPPKYFPITEVMLVFVFIMIAIWVLDYYKLIDVQSFIKKLQP